MKGTKIVSIWLCLFCVTLYSAHDIQAAIINTQMEQLEAADNQLTSAFKKLDMTLSNDGDKSNPKSIIGKLKSVLNRIKAANKKLDKVLNNPPKMDVLPSALQEAINNVAQNAVRISSRAALGFEISPDNLQAHTKLEHVRSLADNILLSTRDYLRVFWGKVIPVRIVMAHNCFPWMLTCAPHFDWDTALAAVQGMNEAFAPASLHFSLSSVDRYFMHNLANEEYIEGTLLDYDSIASEIGLAIDPNLIPDDPPAGVSSYKAAVSWVTYFSTIYSDPTELLIWVFGRDSLVSKEIDRHSISAFPDRGRFVIISAQNIYSPNRDPELSPYHLTHEVGHFFGLPHPWEVGGTHPVENRQLNWTDLWDLSYCTPLFVPIFFDSKAEALEADCELTPIEYHYCPCGEYNDAEECVCPVDPNCKVNNRDETGDSEMECRLNDYWDYFTGDDALKGFSFDLDMAEDPPDSFAYGLNVMGYYSRYNAHLWTPGRFSASQIEIIKGHSENSIPILSNYGVPGLMSLRNMLGED